MKYALFVFVLTVLLPACDKSSTENDSIPPVETEEYTFIDLKFDFSDKEEIIFEQLFKAVEYNNLTDVEQMLPIGDVSSIKNFMFFQTNNEAANYFFENTTLVNVPQYIDDERIYLTEEKYLFSPNNVNLPIDNLPNDDLIIDANSSVNINLNLVLKEYTIGFELSYMDNVLKQKKIISGKWKKIHFIELRKEYL